MDQIVAGIRASSPPPGMTTRIVAVDGQGGAGKSTFAELLAERLGGAQILRTDDFASWDNPLDWWPRLIDEAFAPLARNERGSFRRSDWGDGEGGGWGEVSPAEFVVLEGVSASREAFRPFLAYSIWVETPRDVRLSRGLERDGEQARGQWDQWMAEEDEYIERERPQAHADIVVRGDRPLGLTGS